MVSVIIPAYNAEKTLDRAIRSILNQTYKDHEIIVIDDCSIDDTGKIARGYSLTVRYFRNKTNMDAGATRNRGIREANGDFIALLDADDEWLPTKLEKQMKLLANADIVYCGFKMIAPSGKIIGGRMPKHRGYIFDDLLKGCVVCGGDSTVLAKKECFSKGYSFSSVGYWDGHWDYGFDESLPSGQDWDMWLRRAKAGYKFDYVDEALMLYHQHPKQISQNWDRSIRGTRMIIEKFAIDYKHHPKALASKLVRIGNLYLHEGEMKEGRRYFRMALSKNPFEWKGAVRYMLSLGGFKFYNKLARWKNRKREW